MKKIFNTTFLLLTSVLVLTGCQTNKGEADENNQLEKLTIVTMPDENNPEAGGKNKQFQEDMSKALGVTVEQMEGADYAVGIEAMKNKQLDVLLVSPMSYFQAKQKTAIEPVVTTTSMGASEYRTLFITQKDNNKLNNIEDLKGTNFAFVDPASSSGYMFPKYTLVKELKLSADQLEEPGYFFKTVAYSGKHDASVMGVAKGDYEAAAVAGQVLDQMDAAGLVDKDELKVIGKTDVIPNPVYVMRKDLPEDIKKKIKDFYVTYDNTDYFETFYKDPTVKFVEAHEEDYRVAEDMMNTLGIKGDD